MKRFLLFLLLSLFPFSDSFSQRYIPGQKGFQLTGGVSDGIELRNRDGQAFYVGGAISTYTKKANRWVLGGEYWQRKYMYKKLLLPVSQITVEGGHYVSFLSDPSKTVFFSVGGSVLAGYETLNWGKNKLFDGSMLTGKENFIYGGAISLEMETFLTDKIILLLSARERCLFNTSIRKLHFQAGVGFKFLVK